MAIKGILVDYYGTIVRDNDDTIISLCRTIMESSADTVTIQDVVVYWWDQLNKLADGCRTGDFVDQKTLDRLAVEQVLQHFSAKAEIEDIMEPLMRSMRMCEAYSDGRVFVSRLPLPYLVVTNADREELRYSIEYANLNITNIYTSEDALCYKPQPEIFLKAAQQMNLLPEELLFVGDSVYYDLRPAAQVGMKTAWINRGDKPRKRDFEPDIMVDNLINLKNMMR